VVGTGRIGEAVIDRLRGFGCRTLAHDSRPRLTAEYVGLDDLLRRSDIVTLHVPLTSVTHHLLGPREILLMRPGAHVVNTGRGALVDTEALVRALENGRLGGAGLDVLEGEDGIFYADRRDRPIDNPWLGRLQQLPNVVITPHTAYYTDHALSDAVRNSIANCLRFESGSTHG
jgi:D-specific alpha-keto acid dehydrogenase